jgi:hypothetical protein
MGPHSFWKQQVQLKNSPHEMRQQRKQREHENPAHPDQEVQSHLGIVNLFLVHVPTLAPAFIRHIGWIQYYIALENPAAFLDCSRQIH